MKKYTFSIVMLIVLITFSSCGEKDTLDYIDSRVNNNINISGIAVDNYIKNATVCIDSNKNNLCSDEKISYITTTDSNGKFTFTNIEAQNDMVIIAYYGKDIKTDENFTYILKNYATNTDSNNKVILSSINTLIVDYKEQSNKSLIQTKEAIKSFLGNNIEVDMLSEDLIANKDIQRDEFLRSLKLFQMVDKLNSSNDFNSSANSFKKLAETILNNNNLVHDDNNIDVNISGVLVNAALVDPKPVFLDIPKPSIDGNYMLETNDLDVLSLDFVVDPNGNNIVYTISSDFNGSLFQINNNKIEFINLPTNHINTIYKIRLNANNNINTISKEIIIEVNYDLKIITSSLNVLENNTSVGFIEISNGTTDTIVYSLSGEDSNLLNIDSNGYISINSSPDYETKDSYNFNVIATSPEESVSKNIIINVINQIESPIINSSSFSINENSQYIGKVNVRNDDNLGLTYSLSGADSSLLSIDGIGNINLNTNADYETKNYYSFNVEVTSSQGTVSKSINITINNVIEKPIINTNVFNINENNTSVGKVAVKNDDNLTLSYYLSGTDATFLNIDTNGNIILNNNPNFEVKNNYIFIVNVISSMGTTSKDINISVLNQNDAPIFLNNFTVNIDENLTYVIKLVASDEDNDTLYYDINDTDIFNIDTVSGVVSFKNPPDYESKSSYTTKVSVNDGNITTYNVLNIIINNINDNAPLILTDNNVSTYENQLNAFIIEATDEDNDTLSYDINDTNIFNINHTTGEIQFNTLPDYETKNEYFLNIIVSDGKYSTDKNITINITNISDTNPTLEDTNLNFPENIDINTSIGRVTVIYQGDSNISSFTLNDTSNFDINSSGYIKTNTMFDYESSVHEYNLTVYATNDSNNSDSVNVNIKLNNIIDNVPILGIPSAISIDENISSGTTISTIVTNGSTIDENTTDNFRIISGNDGSFSIDSSGIIKVIQNLDYESTKNYTLEIIGINNEGNSTSVNLDISINNVLDNVPFLKAPTPISVNENISLGTIITTIELNGRNEDENITSSYSIVSGDNSKFSINNNGEVNVTGELDYETINTYKLDIIAINSIGNSLPVELNITINNINDNVPTDINISNNKIFENNDINATVGLLSTIDLDNNISTYIYTLVSGDGDYNNSLFNIIGNELKINFKTDYESDNNFSIRINTNDGNNNFSKIFNIFVEDVSELGAFTTLPVTSVYQNETYEYNAKVNIEGGKLFSNPNTNIPAGFGSLESNGGENIFDINITGTPDDFMVGIQHFDLKVDDNNSNTVTQSFDLTVLDVNDAPKIVNILSNGINYLEDNISTVNVSFGTSSNIVFTINDGDSKSSQNINFSISSDDESVATVSLDKSSIYDDNTTQYVTATISAQNVGNTNIIFNLTDDGGTLNNGVNDHTKIINVKVRANGWKIYENQKDSNYTISNVVFDGISYDWNSTNNWYETNNTILMPVNISNQYGLADNFNLGRLEGHSDVNKSKFIFANRIPEGTQHSLTNEYSTVLSDINITANNNYFSYDPEHKLFVSRTILNIGGDDYAQMTYLELVPDHNDTFVTAPTLNTFYGTDINNSSYSSTNEYIDPNNNGSIDLLDNTQSDFCAKTYGTHWRLATAYEMGINVDSTETYKGYIPAYVGNDDIDIISSTRFGTDDSKIIKLNTNSAYTREIAKSTQNATKCVYYP